MIEGNKGLFQVEWAQKTRVHIQLAPSPPRGMPSFALGTATWDSFQRAETVGGQRRRAKMPCWTTRSPLLSAWIEWPPTQIHICKCDTKIIQAKSLVLCYCSMHASVLKVYMYICVLRIKLYAWCWQYELSGDGVMVYSSLLSSANKML